MKQTFYIVLFFILPFSVLAQPAASFDFGLGVGASSYYGDINQEKFFYKPNFEIDGFARYNFNDRYALRGNIMSTKLEAYDIDFDSPYQKARNASFSENILEMSLLGEVNFFPYLNPQGWDTYKNTIYATVGVGMVVKYGSGKKGENIPLILMGVGYKQVLGKRFALEIEWVFRKCLNDTLDRVVDPTESGITSRLFNNDWYNVLGVKLSYNFWSLGSKCRTFEKEDDL